MNRVYPVHVIGAAAAVLIKGGDILLAKRRYPPGVGKWSIPGGVIEVGEEISRAARRELLEETGIEAEPLGILWVLNNIVYDRDNRVLYHYVIIDILFDPNTIRGELRPGGDVDDVKWFKLSEINHLPEVSRTVKALVRRIEKYGLTTIPLEGVDHVTIQY